MPIASRTSIQWRMRGPKEIARDEFETPGRVGKNHVNRVSLRELLHQKRPNFGNPETVIRSILLYSLQRHAGILGLVRFLNNRYASSRFDIPQSRSPVPITAA